MTIIVRSGVDNMTLETTFLHVTMPDGSTWEVPATAVWESYAKFYRKEDPRWNEDDERAHFDDHQIHDWAGGNMNWDEVETVAVKVADRAPLTVREFQEGWVNGPNRIVRK